MDDFNDLDELIRELNATTADPVTPTPVGDTTTIERWLRIVASQNGSDLLLVAGAPPSVRVEGRVLPLPEGPLDGVDIEEAVLPALPPHARRIYLAERIVDASFRIQNVGRFRINLHRERGRAAAAVRLLPQRVPRLSTLALPPQVEQLASLPRGLVLVGGPTGCGKSTLAALVEEVNRRDSATSSPSRIRSSTSTCTIPASWSSSRSVWMRRTFPRPCGRRCARRRTSSWLARFEQLQPLP